MADDIIKGLLMTSLDTKLKEVTDARLPRSILFTSCVVPLKLKEFVNPGLAKTTLFNESPSQYNQPPPDSLQTEINGEPENLKEERPASTGSEWIVTVRDKLKLAKKDNIPVTWEKLCIYKVPQYLLDGEDKAYFPNFVSLGPYHHGKIHLQAMDRHKWRAFDQILQRGKQDAKLYLDSIKEVEDMARACYEGQITMNSNDFVEMMVIDGCFVLELLCGASKAEGFKKLGYSQSDPVFAMKGSMYSLQRDMLMLENQIPLFILDRLLGLQLDQPGPVAKLGLRFFEPLMPTNEPWTRSDPRKMISSRCYQSKMIPSKSDQSKIVPSQSILFDPLSTQACHFLHMFRMHLLRGPIDRKLKRTMRWSDKRRIPFIHCVTELKEAGVEFKRRETDYFWDITFENGVLMIPRLVIHDGTKSLFLNLIAFEQSHSGCGSQITSYAFFMDNLINSQEDVRYLHGHGILKHRLGKDADVADLFNRLCRDIDFDISNSYLSKIPDKVNQFYDRRWNKWRASLRHKYFYNPWAIISLIAAGILLILTFAQTGYTVYAYHRPPHYN